MGKRLMRLPIIIVENNYCNMAYYNDTSLDLQHNAI